jgi:hypothetical protein
MFERTIAHGEFHLAAVFGNDERIWNKKRPTTNAAEKIKRAGIFVLGLVRRIEKDEVDRLRQFAEALQHSSDATVFQGEPATNLQRGEILPKSGQRGLGIFCKPHMLCPAAYCLDSNGTGPRIEIDEAAAIEARRKDIEEGFAQAIAGGTGLHTARGG